MQTNKIDTLRPIQGFTLVELLISMALLSILLMIAGSTLINSNRTIKKDSTRVATNQNLSSAIDIMTADIRQAGENVYLIKDFKFPSVEFSSLGDWLIVRKVIPEFLPKELPSDYKGATKVEAMKICGVSSTKLTIVSSYDGQTGCPYNAVDTNVPNSDDSNVSAWRNYFRLQDNRPQAAIIYTPGLTSATDIFTRVVINKIDDVIYKTVAPNIYQRKVEITMGSPIPPTTTATNNSTILLLDEHVYSLDKTNNTLNYTQGADLSTRQPLAFAISDLNFTAKKDVNDLVSSINELSIATDPYGQTWKYLKQVDVKVTGGSPQHAGSGETTMQAVVYPRNAESAREYK